jgi:hypothetical protein
MKWKCHQLQKNRTRDLYRLSSRGLADPMSLTELALLEGRRPLPLGDVIGLTVTLTLTLRNEHLLAAERA